LVFELDVLGLAHELFLWGGRLIAITQTVVGETGVKWDTGSKGTVGGKIVDVNKN
jgi:hypothetical protein